jgi:hypothetical protein
VGTQSSSAAADRGVRTNDHGTRCASAAHQHHRGTRRAQRIPEGHCFYCYAPIDIASGSATTCQVDHVFAWSTGSLIAGAPVDGVWNLVLACARCNTWHEKSHRPPHQRYVERLNTRNEYLISSYHPLRPTLIAQTGATRSDRSATLKRAFDQVSVEGRGRNGSRPKNWNPHSDGSA